MKFKAFVICIIMSFFSIHAEAAENVVYFSYGQRMLKLNTDVWSTIDGRYIDFNSNGIPFFAYTETLPEGAVNYVPIRTIAEAVGLIVGYNASDNTIELESADKILRMTVYSPYASVYDKSGNLIESFMFKASASSDTACPVQNIDDTTYIPIRAVMESFGFFVDYSNGQIILASSAGGLYPCDINAVSKKINIFGVPYNIRISAYPNVGGYKKFLENNDLLKLSGFLCRNREGMWLIGTEESMAEYYTDIVNPKYFECIYYRMSDKSPWTRFSDEVPLDRVYEISASMTTVTGDVSFSFEEVNEIANESFRRVIECLYQNSVRPVKMNTESYPASYNAIVSGKSEEAVLYKIYAPYENKNYFVLNVGNQSIYLDSGLFSDVSFTKDETISVPGTGNIIIYCNIAIVDIEDDI